MCIKFDINITLGWEVLPRNTVHIYYKMRLEKRYECSISFGYLSRFDNSISFLLFLSLNNVITLLAKIISSSLRLNLFVIDFVESAYKFTLGLLSCKVHLI